MTDQDRPADWGAVPRADDLRSETATDVPTAGPSPASPAAPQPSPASPAAPQPSPASQAAPQPYPAAPSAQPTPGSQAAPGPYSAAPASAPDPYAQYHPAPRATRRRLGRKGVIGIVAGAAALLLVLVGGTVAYSLGSDAHAPTHQVDAFLEDLEGGHVARALAAAGVERERDDVLLTDAAYRKATGRVTGHTVVDVDTEGDRASVDVYLRQRGRSVPATFTLTRSGTDLGVFPVWKLDPVSLGSLTVTVQGPADTGVSVAGRDVSVGTDGTVTLTALPGTYPVQVDGGGWFEADATTAEVRGLGKAATAQATLTTALTSKGATAAQQAVDGWVDQCVASTSIEPPGCSFYAYGEDPVNTYSNQKWTLDTRPVFSVDGWADRGWAVRTTTAGSATFTADFTGPAGSGTGRAGPIEVYCDGYITGFTTDGATFVPAVTPSLGSGSGETDS